MSDELKTLKDDLCAVYCTQCNEATNAVSYNLLAKVKEVSLQCPRCGCSVIIKLKNGAVSIET
jgi:predicted RNA-binding Zn-ribbon protein involved in translation (DUF1610 family)